MRIHMLSLASVALIAGSSSARANYDETVDGGLSGNRMGPTVFNLVAGANTIHATSMSGDLEYFRVNLPSGAQLTSIMLTSYSYGSNMSFIAVHSCAHWSRRSRRTKAIRCVRGVI